LRPAARLIVFWSPRSVFATLETSRFALPHFVPGVAAVPTLAVSLSIFFPSWVSRCGLLPAAPAPAVISARMSARPQRMPSKDVLSVCTQPLASAQLSSVQESSSSQSRTAWCWHVPFTHCSTPLHAWPSSQPAMPPPLLFVCVQPVVASQVSVVQGLLSLQSAVTSWQRPPTHAF